MVKSFFVSRPLRRRSTCLQCVMLKLNVKKCWCRKNEINFFVSHKNESLFIFWHVIIFLLLCDNKNISPRHDAKIWCQKQKFDVARKIILCWNKKFDMALKVILVSTETCWCSTKKYFMSTKKKVDVAQKYVSCRQKQDDAAS